MYEKYGKEFIKVLQQMYDEQKGKINFAIKGEVAALLYISNFKEVTPKDISEQFKISTARVANGLNSLESKKLIKRSINKEDRRQVNVKVTALGLEKAEIIKKQHVNIFTLILEKLGLEDTIKSLELLKKMQTILNEIDFKEIEGEIDVTA